MGVVRTLRTWTTDRFCDWQSSQRTINELYLLMLWSHSTTQQIWLNLNIWVWCSFLKRPRLAVRFLTQCDNYSRLSSNFAVMLWDLVYEWMGTHMLWGTLALFPHHKSSQIMRIQLFSGLGSIFGQRLFVFASIHLQLSIQVKLNVKVHARFSRKT